MHVPDAPRTGTGDEFTHDREANAETGPAFSTGDDPDKVRAVLELQQRRLDEQTVLAQAAGVLVGHTASSDLPPLVATGLRVRGRPGATLTAGDWSSRYRNAARTVDDAKELPLRHETIHPIVADQDRDVSESRSDVVSRLRVTSGAPDPGAADHSV